MNLNKLDLPFYADDIEWRIQQAGKGSKGIWAKVLAYVTNRAIMKRLDDVCGKAGWRNEYRDIPNNGGVECGIAIKIDGEWITKWDAAENTQVEAVKGGRSGAMKRAAVQWGIGRYLYDLDEGFAVISDKRESGFNYAKSKEVGVFFWKPPVLPAWATPADEVAETGPPSKEKVERTPQQLLEAFTECALKANLSELEKAWRFADRSLNGTDQHDKAKSVYLDRKSELEGADA